MKIRSAGWVLGVAVFLAGGGHRLWGQETPAAGETAAPEIPAPPGAAAPAQVSLGNGAPAGSIEGELISIKLNDVPMDKAVQMFMDISGANIIAAQTNLTGRVTVNLKDVDWREALRGMLELHGMTLIEKGGEKGKTAPIFYVVTERAADAPEPVFIENFILRYKRPATLVDGVTALIAPQGKVLHSSGNMLTIMATADALKNARKLIEETDLRIPQVLIEAKFVELNDQAIKDLGINWQSLEGFQVGVGGLRWEMGDSRSVDERGQRTYRTFDERVGSATTINEVNKRSLFEDNTRKFFDINGVQYQESTTSYEEVPPGSGNIITTTRVTPTREINNPVSSLRASGAKQEDTYRLGTNDSFERPRVDARLFSSVKSAVLTADDFRFTLSALQQSGGADVISNPKIVVASGERATIHVGRKDPEIKAVADTNLQGRLTYQRDGWIESGVRLEVLPIVNTTDSISVTISPQLSRIAGFQESGDTRVRIPILSTREITSQFSLPSGRTVAIGGLTETADREVVKKVPLLGDLPLIGKYLFTHTHTERVQDEIIIFVTLAVAETEDMNTLSGIPADGRLIRSRLLSGESDVRLLPRGAQLPAAPEEESPMPPAEAQ